MMFKRMVFLIFVALAALTTVPATASVIYTWYTIGTSPTMSSFASEIVLNGSSHIQLDWDNCGLPSCPPISDNGIVSISFIPNGTAAPVHHPSSFDVYDHINLNLDPSGFLTGSINFNTGFEDIYMSSVGNLWTVHAVEGDSLYDSSCFYTGFCKGITGYFAVSPSLVPEPAPLLLLALGLVAIALFQGSKKAHIA